MELHAAGAQRFERRLLQLLHRAPPLERDPWLDPGLTAVAEPDGVAVRLASLELVMFLQPVEDARVGLLLRETRQASGLFVHPAVGSDRGDLRQPVVASDLVVERIVSRRDLERTGSEVPLHSFVCDHRHAALDEGDDDLAPDKRAIPIVVRMHRDRDVRDDRGEPHRRDGHVPVARGERIAHEREGVVDLRVRNLEIGERRQVEGAPVDDPVRAVDPALAVEVDEEAHDGAHVRVVHREALAPIVERRSDAPELDHDLAAVLAQPIPDECFERLPSQVVTRLPLGREVLLDRVLRRDPGVVEAGLEEHVVALHPARAHDRVRERELERVSQVKVARHVRGRMRDREAPSDRIGVRVVEALLLPRALPAFLDAFGLVERVHQPAFRESGKRGRGGRLIRSCSDYGGHITVARVARDRLPPDTFDLPVEKIRSGYYSDAYFNFARESLLADGRHPRVSMQVFQKEHAVLGGMDEAIAVLKLCSHDWDALEVRALHDGDAIEPWETVLTIAGDYTLFAHLETVYLGAPARSASRPTRNRPGGAVSESAPCRTR